MGNRLGEGAKRLATIIFRRRNSWTECSGFICSFGAQGGHTNEFHPYLDYRTFCCRMDPDGGNADSYLDRCNAVFLFVGAGLFSLFWIIGSLTEDGTK